MSKQETVAIRHASRAPGHPVLRWFAWSLLALASFGLVFAQTFKTTVEARIETEDITGLLGPDRPAAAAPPEDGAAGVAVNVLLMGSDDRSGENADLGGKEKGKRNDTTIIMHISADRSRVELVSIPRDTMVRVSDCQRSDGTSQKGWFTTFNTAFANGAANGSNSDGAACTIKTVEALTGVRIDHYVVIDFVGFRDMVDAVGGVPMCIEEELADPYSGTYLSPGPQVLDGTQALGFARMRHGKNVDGSDLGRIDRQQQLLKNLASKVLSAEMLYRPQEVTNFIKAVADSITVDEQFGDLDFLAGLGFSLRNLDPSAGIVMATAPIEAYPEDRNRVQFSRKATAIWSALASDQPIAALLDSQSASPANDDAVTAAPADPGTDAGTDSGTDGAAVDPNSQDGILAACSA